MQIKSGLLYVNGELYDTEDTDTIKNAGVAEEEITVVLYFSQAHQYPVRERRKKI